MIYRFIVISSEEESFLREFELDESNTLLDFHNSLQEELEYDRSQIASFFTSSEKWEKGEEFTLFEMGAGTTPMEDVIVDDIILDEHQKILYVFDIFNERTLFIECIGTVDKIEGRAYPVCTRSQGKPPKQILFADFSKASTSIEDIEEDIPVDNDPDISGIDDMEEYDDS